MYVRTDVGVETMGWGEVTGVREVKHASKYDKVVALIEKKKKKSFGSRDCELTDSKNMKQKHIN